MSRSNLHNDLGKYQNDKDVKPSNRLKWFWRRRNREYGLLKPIQNYKREIQADKDMKSDVDEYLFAEVEKGNRSARK